jgi:uncharacterized protein YecT (DUF1311 family)
MSLSNYLTWALVPLSVALISSSAEAQSFDCTKASTVVEHAICNDADVAYLDLRVANAIEEVLTEHPDRKAALFSSERRWLRERDAHCKGYVEDSQGMNSCLLGEYSERLDAIRSSDGTGNPPVSRSGPVLSCDQGSGATIRPLAASESGEARCRVAGGDDILVRWGKLDPFDSESQEQYITRVSVWVNRAKWVEREIIDESGGVEDTYEPPSYLAVPYEIRISPGGLSKCYVEVYGPKSKQTSPPRSCSTLARSKRPTARDTVEFPLNGPERPRTGTIRLVESRNKNLCSVALTNATDIDSVFLSRDGIGSFEESLAPQQLGNGNPGDRVLQFDIDNSGRTQLIVKHTESSRAEMSDTYFAYTKEGLDRIIAFRDPFEGLNDRIRAIEALLARLSVSESRQFSEARISGQADLTFDADSKLTAEEQNRVQQFLEFAIHRDFIYLAAHAEAVYPDISEACVDANGKSHHPAQSMSCATGERLTMPFSMTNADQETISFRDNVSMVPFRFEGATYFRLWTTDTDASNVTFIVKPLPNKQMQLICSVEEVALYL